MNMENPGFRKEEAQEVSPVIDTHSGELIFYCPSCGEKNGVEDSAFNACTKCGQRVTVVSDEEAVA